MPRYDHTQLAYCKYCYETHSDWKLGDDYFPWETVWVCQKCQHATNDDFMQIEGVKPSKRQRAFFRKFARLFRR